MAEWFFVHCYFYELANLNCFAYWILCMVQYGDSDHVRPYTGRFKGDSLLPKDTNVETGVAPWGLRSKFVSGASTPHSCLMFWPEFSKIKYPHFHCHLKVSLRHQKKRGRRRKHVQGASSVKPALKLHDIF